MPACDIRRAYHTAVISTDAGYSHVTKRVQKNVSPPLHRHGQRGMRRDAERGNRNEPVDSQSASSRIVTIHRSEYFTRFNLLD